MNHSTVESTLDTIRQDELLLPFDSKVILTLSESDNMTLVSNINPASLSIHFPSSNCTCSSARFFFSSFITFFRPSFLDIKVSKNTRKFDTLFHKSRLSGKSVRWTRDESSTHSSREVEEREENKVGIGIGNLILSRTLLYYMLTSRLIFLDHLPIDST